MIRRVEHYHSGDSSHKRKILAALMRSAVLAYGDPRMRTGYLYVEVGIAHRVPDLLVSPARCEHCERCRKGHLSAGCKTGGNAYHVSLGYTAVEETVRICLLKDLGLCSSSKVCVKNHNFGMLLCKLAKRKSEAFSRSYFLCFCHDYASNAAS